MIKNLFVFIFVVSITVPLYAQDALNNSIDVAFEHYSVGGYSEAAPLFEEAYNILTTIEQNDYKGRFKLALYTGLSYKHANNYKLASYWFATSIEHAKVLDDSYSIAIINTYLADTERLQGNFNKAIEYYNVARSLDMLDDKDIAAVYYGLAYSYNKLGNTFEAVSMCNKVITNEIFSRTDKLRLLCDVVVADSYLANEDYSEALKIYGHVNDIAIAKNYTNIQIDALIGHGITSDKLKFYDIARHSFEDALLISIENNYYEYIGEISEHLLPLINKSRSVHENIAEEIDNYGNSLTLIESDISMKIWKLAVDYYMLDKNYDNMYDVAENIFGYAGFSSSDKYMFIGLYYMGVASYYLKEYVDSAKYVASAIVIAERIGNSDYLSTSYALQAEIYAKNNDYSNASLSMQQAYELASDLDIRAQYNKRLININSMISGIKSSSSDKDIVIFSIK